jgi:hypothetical protein
VKSEGERVMGVQQEDQEKPIQERLAASPAGAPTNALREPSCYALRFLTMKASRSGCIDMLRNAVVKEQSKEKC